MVALGRSEIMQTGGRMPKPSHHERTALKSFTSTPDFRDWRWLLWVTLAICSGSPAYALKTGDVLVTTVNSGQASLAYVARTSGEQHVLVSVGHFSDVVSLATGDIFVLAEGSLLLKIDAVSGGSTVISSLGLLRSARTLDMAPDGNLYVTDGVNGLIRVDPASGAQAVVTPGVIHGFATGAQGVGYIALADDDFSTEPYHIYRVDLTTGATDLASPTGLAEPAGMVAEGTNNLLICQTQNFSGDPVGVLRMKLETGAVTTVSADSRFMVPLGIAVEDKGDIIMSDNQHLNTCAPPGGTQTCVGALYRIDPVTGATTLLADQGLMNDARGVDIYRGPSTPTPTRRVSWGSVKAHYR